MNRSSAQQARAWLILGFIVGAGPIGLFQELAQARPVDAEPPGRVTIWVYNYARVPGRTLAQAEMEIDRILGEAGVGTEWVECPLSAREIEVHPLCQERMSPTEIALVIAPQFTARAGDHGDTYFGSAQVFTNGQFGHYTYLFYDRIENPVHRGEASVYQIIANVAAHEIGHLLLRSNLHSAQGLMRAQWDRSDLHRIACGQLRFGSEESKIIHAEVLARGARQERVESATSSAEQR